MPRSGCMTKVRFNMKADILKPLGAPETVIDVNTQGELGHWEYRQNEDSGAIERVWVDDPGTIDVDEGAYQPGIIRGVPLLARGIIDGGIRVAGTTERFSSVYEAVDFVKATFPKSVNITNRDRVTNVRNNDGVIVWKEEQIPGAPATVFNVMGVTPVMDPFSKLMEYAVLLQRAEVQSAS